MRSSARSLASVPTQHGADEHPQQLGRHSTNGNFWRFPGSGSSTSSPLGHTHGECFVRKEEQ